MAYLPAQNRDEEEVKPALGSSGEAGIVQPGVSTEGPAPTTSAPPPGSGTGSGFVDIRRYLEQNAGKTGKLANRIGGDVEKAAGEAEKGVDTAKSAFDTEANKNNAIDEGWIKSSLSNPLQTVSDPLSLDRFNAYRTGTYRGPSMMGDVDISGAQAKGNETTNASGLEDLMSGYSSDPTKGKAGLNTALLTQSPEAQSRLEAARSRTGALTDYLNNAKTASQATATSLSDALKKYAPTVTTLGQSEVDRMKAALTSGYQGSVKNSLDEINQPIYDANQADYDWVQNTYAGNPDQMAHIYNQNARTYNSSLPYDVNQYASADDFAREAALEQLMNQQYDALDNNQSDRAGTWQAAVDQAKTAAAEEAAKAAKWGYGVGTRGDPAYTPMPFTQQPTWEDWLNQGEAKRAGVSGW